MTIDDGEYIEYDAANRQIRNHDGAIFVEDVANSYVRWNSSSTGLALGVVQQRTSANGPINQLLETAVTFRN